MMSFLARSSSSTNAALLRAMTRGSFVASSSRLPWSMRFSSTLSTAPIIVEPPGEPIPSHGEPSGPSTSVGDMLDRGRFPPNVFLSAPRAVRRGFLPPSAQFAYFLPAASRSCQAKSVSSLLRRKPRPGTTRAEPMFISIVVVQTTMLPSLSTTLKCVVPCLKFSGSSANRRPEVPAGVPASTGSLRKRQRCIRSRRSAAYDLSTRPARGTSTKSASAWYRLRSANARF
mmetsp:Transcript_40047/g.86660  ORF Transcript_40047/g.86660 Transcript_40047/m.86660 type:complete len:229 (+) Transcript_40047:215-901(+)